MPDFGPIGKFLVVSGIVIVAAGLFFMFGIKYIPLFRLPGDIFIKRGNFSLYFPIVTSIILSILLTIILNLIFRR